MQTHDIRIRLARYILAHVPPARVATAQTALDGHSGPPTRTHAAIIAGLVQRHGLIRVLVAIRAGRDAITSLPAVTVP